MNNNSVDFKPTIMQRINSNPLVRKVTLRSQRVFNNICEKHAYGVSLTKANAKDTMKEMGKFFSITEAKAALEYSKELAKETHEELVGQKVKLLSDTIGTVFLSQTRSIFDRNYYNIDNSADNESEDDE